MTDTLHHSFIIFTAVGTLCHVGKKFHAWPGWDLLAFLKKNAYGLLGSAITTALIAYCTPDLLLLAPDEVQLEGLAAKSPGLVEKLMDAFGFLLGFTGGSIGFDILALLENIPIIGPILRKLIEGIKPKGDAPQSPADGAGS